MKTSIRMNGANGNGIRSARLRVDRGDRLIELRGRNRHADRAFGRPMGARADRLDPHARMRMSNERVGFEAERAVGLPIPTPEFDQAIAAIRPKAG